MPRLAITLSLIVLVVQPRDARAQTTHAASGQGALADTLIALERQSWVAWQHRDGRFYAGFLSDDHVEMGSRGRSDKATVVSFVGSPACVVDDYALDAFSVAVLTPDVALVTYHAAQHTRCGGNPVPSPAWVSSLYVRRGGRWLNAAYQQTPAAGQ